ncbi:MAG: PLP-dependent transferase, partial [Pirellulales bacterium]
PQQPRVGRVHYPGLSDQPGHDLARQQLHGGFGGMVSFEIAGDVAAARRVVESTKIFRLAVSLGAVESLIELPAVMSHGAYAPEARRAVGITDGLIRLSVGLEAAADLEADLASALATLGD